MNNVTTIAGKEAFFDYYRNLDHELREGDFYFVFAFQNEYQSDEVKNFLVDFHRRLAQKKIDDRAIFKQKIASIAQESYQDNKNIQLKFKDFDIPVGLVVTKDRVLQLGWKPEPFIVEIKNKILFKYYYDFFMGNWNTNQSIEFTKEVLDKLNVRFSEESLQLINNLRDNQEALEVANGIEKIEDTWSYEHKSAERQFGQKVVGETIGLWSVPRSTAELLEFLVVATGAKTILEIGTSAGYSTLYLAMGATYTGGHVHTVELLKPKIDLAKKHFKNSGLTNITLHEGSAQEILGKGNIRDIDLVFLDADKENYGKYFDLFMPLLKKDGFIIADNIFDYGHMMKDYLDKVLGTKLPGSRSDKRIKSYTLPLDNGVLISRKLGD